MIFVTVGTQLAFDRLVVTMDDWAEANPSEEVFAQIGPTSLRPRAMPYADFVPPGKADALMRRAKLIISHAGMGSILTAMRYQRPILILPRKADLGEHRNNHQLATARWLEGRPGICVAWSEAEILARLSEGIAFSAGPQLHEFANGPLVEKLQAFIARQA